MLKKTTTTPTAEGSSSSSYLLLSYPSELLMNCEKLLPLISGKSASMFNNEKVSPLFFQQLLARQNLTLDKLKTADECLQKFGHLMNMTSELNTSVNLLRNEFDFNHRSRSLIIFVVLIAFVSFISIIGNLCLAKVLYTKRNHLTQTDRIVLCLALSELCLVLIDSPTEIYRHLSYTFSQEWLCRFHTFFESLLSSCIIFYHLLGAFDRFVYIHGHSSTGTSTWAKWCRRASSKTFSGILLCLPILVSLPIAICNHLHAHILHTFANLKICTIQYTHPTLIAILIGYCILPLALSFFLYAKLIYFIRSRHDQHYLTAASYVVPMKRNITLETKTTVSKKRRHQTQTLFLEQQLLHPKPLPRTSHRHMALMNTGDTAGTATKPPGTTTTTTTTTTGRTGTVNNTTSSNSSASSRSSTVNSSASLTSPVIFYKVNSQATANANRTLLLLVLLLSFYVLCWGPYNIYTWRHAYQLVHSSSSSSSSEIEYIFNDAIKVNKTRFTSNNLSSSLLNDTNLVVNRDYESKLLRVILINYSLYLLSTVSMCFSFIFYFSLNKQARHQFSRFIRCLCPWMIHCRKGTKRNRHLPHRGQQQQFYPNRRANNNVYYRPHYNQMAKAAVPTPPILPTPHYHRSKTIKFSNHPVMVPPLVVDRYNFNSTNHSKKLILSRKTGVLCGDSTKRPMVTYGCHVQCCP